jgi:hypothetical protein
VTEGSTPSPSLFHHRKAAVPLPLKGKVSRFAPPHPAPKEPPSPEGEGFAAAGRGMWEHVQLHPSIAVFYLPLLPSNQSSVGQRLTVTEGNALAVLLRQGACRCGGTGGGFVETCCDNREIMLYCFWHYQCTVGGWPPFTGSSFLPPDFTKGGLSYGFLC